MQNQKAPELDSKSPVHAFSASFAAQDPPPPAYDDEEKHRPWHERLSRKWKGRSVGHNGVVTWWRGMNLVLMPHPNQKIYPHQGTVIGSGVSLWKNEAIEFALLGVYDLEKKLMTVTKKHEGTRGEVSYVLTLNVKDAAPLDKISMTNDFYRAHLIPDCVTDSQIPPLTPATATASATSTATATAAAPQMSKESRSEKLITPATPLTTKLSQSAAADLDEKKVRPAAWHERLSCLWKGTSFARNHDKTWWKNTTMILTPHIDQKLYPNQGLVNGTGISFWANREIPFTLIGEYNLSTKIITVRKSHHATPYTQIDYVMTIHGSETSSLAEISITSAANNLRLVPLSLSDLMGASLSSNDNNISNDSKSNSSNDSKSNSSNPDSKSNNSNNSLTK